jgi:CheY-like chemotaxis protein
VEASRVFLPDLSITDYAMPDMNGWATSATRLAEQVGFEN